MGKKLTGKRSAGGQKTNINIRISARKKRKDKIKRILLGATAILVAALMVLSVAVYFR